MPTPWAAKGMVMRTVVEAAGDREIDTTDGVRVIEPGKGWVLVLPDPSEAITHMWVEGPDPDSYASAARRVGRSRGAGRTLIPDWRRGCR